MGKVEVGAAIGASFRYVGEAWTKAWGVMLILVWFTAMLAAIQALKPDWGLATPLGTIVTFFLSTAATGALYRLSLTQSHPGDGAFAASPSGLQWGALEWRVMGANIMVGLAVGGLALIAFIVWVIAVGVAAGASGGPDVQLIEQGSEAERLAAFGRLMLGPVGVVAAVIGIPAVFGLFWVSAKLALVAPQAADTGAFSFGSAWRLSRGAVLALVVTSFLIFVAQAVIGAIFGGVAGFLAGVTGQVGQGPIWGGIAGEGVSAAVNLPLFAGLVLYVYRAQRGDPGVAATFS
jgi:hypothetical protein